MDVIVVASLECCKPTALRHLCKCFELAASGVILSTAMQHDVLCQMLGPPYVNTLSNNNKPQ